MSFSLNSLDRGARGGWRALFLVLSCSTRAAGGKARPHFGLAAAALLLASGLSAGAFKLDDDSANAAANMGELLFLETRFAQFFFTSCNGDVNAIVPNITNSDYTGGEIIKAGDTNVVLKSGDPVMAALQTISGPLPGPF